MRKLFTFIFISLGLLVSLTNFANADSGAGGRLYGVAAYYKLYNQLCPMPLGYVNEADIEERLLTQDDSICETLEQKIAEFEAPINTDGTDNSNVDGVDDSVDADNVINTTGNDEGPVVTDDMTNKHLYNPIRTIPSEGKFEVMCVEEDGVKFGKIILHDASGNLMTGVGKKDVFNADGILVSTEVLDYIYIKPENLGLYMSQEEISRFGK